MKKSKVLALVLALVLCLSSVGVAALAESESVEIRAAWWGDTKRNEIYNQIVDEFMVAYPHIKVIPEPTSWNDYWDKMAVQTAGGNAPDFISMHPMYASDYIGRGVMAPLDPFVADGVISQEGWEPGVIATGVVKDVNYMVPMGITFTSVLANKGFMEELGITVPESGALTWENMKTLGLEAREKLDAAGLSDVWLFTDPFTTYSQFRYFVRGNGREQYDQDGEINFTQQDVEDWFAMCKEWRDLGIIPDAATANEYGPATLEENLFARKMILMMIIPVNQYGLYMDSLPGFELAALRHIAVEGGSVAEFPEGAHFGVSANASPEKQLAAAQLLNFWVNTPEALKLFKLDQGVPGNTSLQDAYVPELNANQLVMLDFVTDVSKVATPTTFAPFGATEVDAAFAAIADEVRFDMITPAEAAETFYAQALDIIASKK